MLYDFLIFIGRFQPFHNGHKYIIKKGLEISNNLIVFCGSANKSRTLKNPFTFLERKKFITDSFSNKINSRLYLESLDDFDNDRYWLEHINQIVKRIAQNKSVALIGYTKDESSYYLKLFNNMKYIEISKIYDIDATNIRKIIFSFEDARKIKTNIKSFVPNSVLKLIIDFLDTDHYLELKNKYMHSFNV